MGAPRRSWRRRWQRAAGALVVLVALGLAGGCGGPQPSVAPTDPPPTGPDVGAIRYSCGGPPGFLPGLLDGPATAETEAHPSAAALRAAIAQVGLDIDMLPNAGYWLIHRDAAEAQYLARRGPGLIHVSFEAVDGAWRLTGWGDCQPVLLAEDRSLATWILDPEAEAPGPGSTTFTALVTERACTGGQPMGGRLLPPTIAYQVDAVLVVFAAVPLAGDAFSCPGNPATRVVVELREPLGDRSLLDAAFFPPADPASPPP